MPKNYFNKNESQGTQGMTPWPYCHLGAVASVDDEIDLEKLYPEIFYILQPYIMGACNQMEMNNGELSGKELMDYLNKCISEDVLKRYPQFQSYGLNYETRNWETARFGGFGGGGLFNDLIDILLINELLRRRRRY